MKKLMFVFAIAGALVACDNSAKDSGNTDTNTVAPVDTNSAPVDTSAATVDTTVKADTAATPQ